MDNDLYKRSSKAGLPPGALIYTGEYKNENSQLDLIIYNVDQCQVTMNVSLEQCLLQPTETSTLWINVAGLHDVKLIEQLNEHFKIHPLVTEDILNTSQRAKVEEYDGYLFLTLKQLNWDEKK